MKGLRRIFGPRKLNKGFSLAEVMVAAGMVAAISLALMQVMSNASKSQKKMNVDMGINDAVGDIKNILRSEFDCTKAFATRPFAVGGSTTPVGNNLIRYNSTGAILKTYSIYTTNANNSIVSTGPDSRAWITNISLSNLADTGNQTGTGRLLVTFSRIDPALTGTNADKRKNLTLFGGTTVTKEFDVRLRLNPALNQILGCNSDLADYQEEMCTTALRGQWDEVNQKCKGIKIENVSPVSGRSQAIEADDLKVMQGLQVGGAATTNITADGVGIGTAPTGAGNLNMTGNAVIAGRATISKGANITGSVLADSFIYNAPASTFTVTSSNNTINGPTRINGVTTVVGATTITGVTTVNGNTAINGTATISGLTTINNYAKVTNTPSVAYPLAAANREFIPNAYWVDQYLKYGIANMTVTNNSSLISEMLAKMTTYVNNQPLNAVSEYVCARMRIKNKDGTLSAAGANCAALNTPDTRCDASGQCARVCIGADCRTAWPVDTDTRCDVSGRCGQLCIGTDCRTAWPSLRAVTGCYVSGGSFCSTTTVAVGLYYRTWSAISPVCCSLSIR